MGGLRRFGAFCAIALAALASAAQGLAQERRVLRFGLQGAVGSESYQGALRAAEVLAESSDGRIVIEIHPASELGDYLAMMEQVTRGELDITLNPFGGMGPWVPRAAILGHAYVIRDFRHLQQVIASAWGQAVLEEMRIRYNWRTLDSWYFGTRHVTANRPIRGIEDFRGLRLRVPNSSTQRDFAEAMGAIPLPIAFADVYSALASGEADAQENPLPTIEAMHFYEVQGYLTLTGHTVVDQLVLISEQSWQSLGEDERRLVQNAILAGGEENDRIVHDGEANLLAFFRAQGMEVIEPDLGPMRAAMQPVYDRLDAQFGAGMVETILAVH
jgi:TRAP-type transport system periplasmic protein